MKIKIRRGLFETNSSSMHSIVVVKPENIKEKDYFKHYAHNGKISLGYQASDTLNFGRSPFKILHTFMDKVKYAIASYATKEKFDEINEYVKHFCNAELEEPVDGRERFFFTTDLVRDENGQIPEDHILYDFQVFWDDNKKDWYREKDGDLPERIYDIDWCIINEPYYGSVDHQSAGLLNNFLIEQGITLKQFLENPKYIVLIDGDEYGISEILFESGMCSSENFEYCTLG